MLAYPLCCLVWLGAAHAIWSTETARVHYAARRRDNGMAAAARAQQTAMPMIGFHGGSSWEYAQMGATFRKGFGETGLLIVVLALVKPLSPPGDLSGQLICGPIEA